MDNNNIKNNNNSNILTQNVLISNYIEVNFCEFNSQFILDKVRNKLKNLVNLYRGNKIN